MRGYVHKRGATWAVVHDAGHDENSRRRQRWKSGFATRHESQAFLTDVLGRLGDGSYAQPSQRSRSTPRLCASSPATVRRNCSSATLPGPPTSTATSCSQTSSAGRSPRIGSPVGFGKHRKAAWIPTGTLHTLRHTAAALALTEGVPVHIVAAKLGDDPNTVLSTCAHLLPQSDEVAAERVAAVRLAPC